MNEESDKEAVVLSWLNAFKRAADFDAWGQPIEAIDVYERLSSQLHANCDDHVVSAFSESEKKVLEKIAVCLDSRKKTLQVNASHLPGGVSLVNLRKLEQAFQTLLDASFDEHPGEFPVDVTLASDQLRLLSFQSSASQVRGGGSLLPKPLPTSGKTLLSVTIDKMDMKDASQYLDPFITVSVRDSNEKLLGIPQDTPVAGKRTESEVVFSQCVHIQQNIEDFPPGVAVFFELKHFKPKKRSTSTKCWAFFEQDEIKEGRLALEIYKKPTDYSRKALKLLSVKPLYLHLRLSLLR